MVVDEEMMEVRDIVDQWFKAKSFETLGYEVGCFLLSLLGCFATLKGIGSKVCQSISHVIDAKKMQGICAGRMIVNLRRSGWIVSCLSGACEDWNI